MNKVRHLNNAPITEALIDLRVQNPKGFDPIAFSPDNLKLENYPNSQERRSYGQEFKIEKGRATASQMTEGLLGYFLSTEDGKNVAQFRKDGFTFSRLKPYISWDDLFQESKKLWDAYCSISTPETVTRIAVRYINHIELPLPIDDFSKYLTAPPTISDNIPNEILSFLNKILVQDSELELIASITQSLERASKEHKAVLLLDIDAFKPCDIEPGEEQILDILNQLHELKNNIFFQSLTDELMRSFE